ncbi:MAG TPA: orotidine-5'-phosphate decarboxylase [Bacillota bacterium]|nr:orotidine-5'-phosphate decarboxylase [Bacillota bacterium]
MMNERLIVALDLDSQEEALQAVKDLGPSLRFVKVGMELFYSSGPGFIARLKDLGLKIFLDLKVHDIPNTAKRAIGVLSRLGCDMLNVHCGGGLEMMSQAFQALEGDTLLIGVTQLTSTDQDVLNTQLGIPGSVEESVLSYAKLAQEAGLAGVVCSPQEVKHLKKELGSQFVAVTPGVRPVDGEIQDQKRVMTPGEAIGVGSDYLVVGRPIMASSDRRGALEKIIEEMEAAHK